MNIRSLIGASAVVIALSTAAFAATTPAPAPVPTPVVKPMAKPVKLTGAQICASLEQQFSDAAAKDKDNKKLPAAQKLADEGTKLCTTKKYASGERKLTAALKDLGVKAKT
jgi:hypothetical protein